MLVSLCSQSSVPRVGWLEPCTSLVVLLPPFQAQGKSAASVYSQTRTFSCCDSVLIAQIAIFVLPTVCLVGWMSGHPFTLDLDPLSVIILTLSVIHACVFFSDGLVPVRVLSNAGFIPGRMSGFRLMW